MDKEYYPTDEIINYIMKSVDAKTFDICLRNGSLQFLYENKKNHLVHTYFGGSTLKYSVKMVEIMKPYNSEALRLSELNEKIKDLKSKITRAKRYNGNRERIIEMLLTHNELVKEFNEKSKPIRRLINKYYKLNKNAGITK